MRTAKRGVLSFDGGRGDYANLRFIADKYYFVVLELTCRLNRPFYYLQRGLIAAHRVHCNTHIIPFPLL